jgi:hypothetical protein
MNGQLVVAVSATASDGQKTTVPSAPVAVVAGEPPVEPPVDPDDGGKYLSGDEILTIKESLVTIAKIIE